MKICKSPFCLYPGSYAGKMELRTGRKRRRVIGWQDRIIIDPGILVGKPVVKGTRLAVEFIIDLLAQGWTEAEILRNYPGLKREDIQV
jgi:uncharacterized protein (DUF433 family)